MGERTIVKRIENMVKVNETIALKIVAVIAYLWIIPVIDSLDSYSYGMATRGLITSFVSFVIGVLGGVKFLQYTTSKGSWVALIISSIVLMIFLVIYPLIFEGYLPRFSSKSVPSVCS